MVARIRYREHSFKVEHLRLAMPDPSCTDLQLIITMLAPDAAGVRDGLVRYSWEAPVPLSALDSEEILLRWIFEQVVRNDFHEAQEFFKLDDTTPFDPHASGQPAVKVIW